MKQENKPDALTNYLKKEHRNIPPAPSDELQKILCRTNQITSRPLPYRWISASSLIAASIALVFLLTPRSPFKDKDAELEAFLIQSAHALYEEPEYFPLED